MNMDYLQYTYHIYKFDGRSIRVRTVEGTPVMALPDLISALGLKAQNVYGLTDRNEQQFLPHLHTLDLPRLTWAAGLSNPSVRLAATRMIDADGLDLLLSKINSTGRTRITVSRFYSWGRGVLRNHVNDHQIDGGYGTYLILLDRFILNTDNRDISKTAPPMAERFKMTLDRFSQFARARRVELGLPPLRKGGIGAEVYSLPVPDQLEVTVRLIMRGDTSYGPAKAAKLIQQCKREGSTVKEML